MIDFFFYHVDDLKSVAAISDQAEVLSARYKYNAYGHFRDKYETITNSFTFTGREWDTNTKLFYYRTRYVDAKVGRFISKDKFSGFHNHPLSLNKYIYAENNPILFNDPTGNHPLLLGLAIAAASGAASDLIFQFLLYGDNVKCYSWHSVAFGAIAGATGLGAFRNFVKIRQINNSFGHAKKTYKYYLKKIRSRKYSELDYDQFVRYEQCMEN